MADSGPSAVTDADSLFIILACGLGLLVPAVLPLLLILLGVVVVTVLLTVWAERF